MCQMEYSLGLVVTGSLFVFLYVIPSWLYWCDAVTEFIRHCGVLEIFSQQPLEGQTRDEIKTATVNKN